MSALLDYMGVDEDALWNAGTSGGPAVDFKPLGKSSTFLSDLHRHPGHACNRLCPVHGDLAHLWRVTNPEGDE